METAWQEDLGANGGAPVNKGMTIFTDEGGIAAVFYSVKREGDRLVVDAKALDAMRMDMVFTVGEVSNGLKLVFSWAVISFILLLPYFWLRQALRKRGGKGGAE